MKHNVHLFAIVKILVPDVEADTHEEALQKAEKQVDFHPLLTTCKGAFDVEYADEITEYLVDELADNGDYDERHSDWWKYKNGELVKIEGNDL